MAGSFQGKLKAWTLTFNHTNGTDLPSHALFAAVLGKLNPSRYVFQLERGLKTGNLHFQCFVVLKKPTKGKDIRDEFVSFFRSLRSEDGLPYYQGGSLTTSPCHDEVAAEKYCTKDEDAKDGRVKGTKPVFYPTARYNGEDLFHYADMFDWQKEVHDWVLNTKANDRSVPIIVDYDGKKGKSKLVKLLGFHHNARVVPLGLSAAQMKSAIVNDGPRDIYLIDIPRNTRCHEDIFNVCEELKRGFVVSSYYGNMNDLFMNCPHIVCFMNQIPDLDLLSKDMWEVYTLVPTKGSTKPNFELQGEDTYAIAARQRQKKLQKERDLNKFSSQENKR